MYNIPYRGETWLALVIESPSRTCPVLAFFLGRKNMRARSLAVAVLIAVAASLVPAASASAFRRSNVFRTPAKNRRLPCNLVLPDV